MNTHKFADDKDVFCMAKVAREARSTVLQWNPSFGETLDRVDFGARNYVKNEKNVMYTFCD